jgi:hypothetical protein
MTDNIIEFPYASDADVDALFEILEATCVELAETGGLIREGKHAEIMRPLGLIRDCARISALASNLAQHLLAAHAVLELDEQSDQPFLSVARPADASDSGAH